MSNRETDIELKMVELIESMTTPDYNNDWGICNVSDPANRSAFPYCNLYYEEEEDYSEEVACTTAMANKLIVRLEVYAKPIAVRTNNRFSFNSNLNDCRTDLKKIFNNNLDLGGLCMDITYKGTDKVGIDQPGRAERPTYMNIYFEVIYQQLRLDPNLGPS
jgi:hypothetical protein